MKPKYLLLMIVLCFSLLLSLYAPAPTPISVGFSCPTSAIFLALSDQIRGNPFSSQGATMPCQVLSGDQKPLRIIGGAQTQIAEIGILGTNKIAVAPDGTLAVSEPHGIILLFNPGAQGNVPPDRIISDPALANNDQAGIALRLDGLFSPVL